MNNHTTVTVSGAGGIISYEMILIQRALEAAGILVCVKDDMPRREDPDAYIAHRQKLNTAANRGSPDTVHLIANHIPWGG